MAEQTRTRVLDAAARLGYQPNRILAGLAAGRFRNRGSETGIPVAVLTRAGKPPGSGQLSDLFYGCAGRGLVCSHFETTDYPDSQALSRQLYHRGVSGLFFHRITRDDGYWEAFDFRPFALVSLDGAFAARHPGIPLCRITPFASMIRAWEACRRKGYRRISSLIPTSKVRSPYTIRLLAASRYCLRESAARDRIEPMLVPTGKPVQNMHSAVSIETWITNKRIQAVITPGLGRAALQRSGCPHVILQDARPGETGFANVQTHQFDQAAWLMELMIRARETGLREGPAELIVHGEWQEGSTLGSSIE